MNKTEADKARAKLIRTIKRQLKLGAKVRYIADATGYTTSRIYQIKGDMVRDGELKK